MFAGGVAENLVPLAFPEREGLNGCRDFCLLFDIVDLDEGTCGRRLAGSGLFKGSDTRSKPSRSHMSFTYPYVTDGCCSFWTVAIVRKKYVQSGSLR